MWINDMTQIAETIGYDGTSFVRASNTEPGFWYQNTSLLCGLSTTQSFWSVNSPYVLDYLDTLAVSDVNNNAWQFTNLDNRAILNELASVSYLYCLHPEKLPTGYSETALDPETANSVYDNAAPLSLGYTYGRTITREQFDALTPAQRQEILLTHAVTQSTGALQDTGSAEDLAAGLECRNVPYEITKMSDTLAHPDDLTFVALEGGAQVELTFDPVTSGECYLYMENVRFKETFMYDLYTDNREYDPDDLYTSEMFNDLSKFEQYQLYQDKKTAFPAKNVKISADFKNGRKTAATNEVNYILPDDEQFYSGRQDFLLNSYTIGGKVDSIVVTFPVRGVYRFDEFSVISEPLTTYRAKTEQLSAESLENIRIDQNKSSFISTGVTGEITVAGSKLLCLTVPYSEGWKAYVDGSPAALENVNLMFCGLWLSPGHHTIELHYETPGLLYGLCLSAAGLLFFLFWMIMSHRSRKRHDPDEGEDVSGSGSESDNETGDEVGDEPPADSDNSLGESPADGGPEPETRADGDSAEELTEQVHPDEKSTSENS